MMLWAVHISDGVLNWPWWVGGFVLALPLVLLALYRLPDRMVPRLGVLTAVVFVASQIHLPMIGTSVHPLFNGLAGVLLGRRVAVTLLIALTLQAVLFAHGGLLVIGLNTCILTFPALVTGVMFHLCIQLWGAKYVTIYGAILGCFSAFITVVANMSVLYLGTSVDFAVVVAAIGVASLPVIAIEGIVVGFAVGVLAKAKPDWLGIKIESNAV